MKRLTGHGLIFLLLLLLLDWIVGSFEEHFFYKQTHGDDYITLEVLDHTKAGILILGSSRASHHYVTDSLERYTGQPVFNGGRDNMGIHYTEAILQALLQRHTPSCIILDLIPYNFLNNQQNNPTYFDIQTTALMPFANRHPVLYPYMQRMNAAEAMKGKWIKTYAFNSLAGSIFQNACTHIGHLQQKGYEPLQGITDSLHYGRQLFPFPKASNGVDTASFNRLEHCLQLCREKKVKVILCFSPFYFPYKHEPVIQDRFHELATRYACPLVDFSSDPSFTGKGSLFYDELHLNHTGAVLFSKRLCDSLRTIQP